jgi:protocatechuate 3,4-dioxygenase beta subunit
MTRDTDAAPVFLPYDEATQPARAIEDYPRSLLRTPIGPFITRPATRSERTGPTGLARKLRLGPEDLSRPDPAGPQAIGQLVSFTGQVLDEDDAPVAGAVLELWQANAAGKYVHEYDQNDAPIDPHFVGASRLVTDQDGRFTFRTIKPGAYPVAHSTWEWRAPHIHASIFGGSWMNRLVTQLFFPGEWLNGQDLLLNAIPNPDARERLIARPLPTVVRPSGNMLGFEHRFVLRGRRGTPAAIDDDEAPATSAKPFASMTTGPFFPPQFMEDGLRDLTVFEDRRARGQKICLSGRILDSRLDPAVNAIAEIWQADAAGILRHPSDPRYADIDPGFFGWGRANTDTDGWYRFVTVVPGGYEEAGAMRRPHVNLMILASGIMRPLVTTLFFGDPLDAGPDAVLDAVPEPLRPRLFAVRDASLDRDGVPAYRFDVVLRGPTETPFFLE